MWIPMHPLKRQLILGFTIIALITLAILFFVTKQSSVFDFPTVPNTGGKSLEEIRLAGDPVYCTFSNSHEKETRHGQFFTFGGLVYMSVYGADKQEVVFFLNNNQDIYTWRSQKEKGLKYPVTQNPVYENDKISINLATIVNGICVDKQIEPTQFLLPPNVIFETR